MAKIGFIAIIVIHGLIHLLGFLKAFQLAKINELTQSISRPLGILWLMTALLFVAAVIAFAFKNDYWWAIGLAAVLLSQILIITFWKDAKFGTIPNLLILIVALLNMGSFLFERGYRLDVQSSLQRSQSAATEIITEADIQSLPEAVRRYLIYAGVIGKPRVANMRVLLAGEMRDKGKDYFPFTSEQYNFCDEPTRLFFMKGKMFGMTVPGYHRYKDKSAMMDVRLFGMLSVIKLTGDVAYVADTVTLFNDMCLFAPATLIDPRIKWQIIDEQSVHATFTNNGISITAVLYFNAEGQLVNFVSEDRMAVADMKKYTWSTPISRYQILNGYNLPAFGEAIWHYPDGDFTYGKIEIKDVEYNIRDLK
ncbi:MAG: hypothetical protein EHM72_09630 [Calditrichaeota bacterium]|nr:MAG: hypothetical protein EHM72_09630 [Calditrichota bacterium]